MRCMCEVNLVPRAWERGVCEVIACMRCVRESLLLCVTQLNITQPGSMHILPTPMLVTTDPRIWTRQ